MPYLKPHYEQTFYNVYHKPHFTDYPYVYSKPHFEALNSPYTHKIPLDMSSRTPKKAPSLEKQNDGYGDMNGTGGIGSRGRVSFT